VGFGFSNVSANAAVALCIGSFRKPYIEQAVGW
jgi:hypothetical protein